MRGSPSVRVTDRTQTQTFNFRTTHLTHWGRDKMTAIFQVTLISYPELSRINALREIQWWASQISLLLSIMISFKLIDYTVPAWLYMLYIHNINTHWNSESNACTLIFWTWVQHRICPGQKEGFILALHTSRVSQRQIACQLHCNRSTISRTIWRYQQSRFYLGRPRPGRHQAT